MKKDEADKLFDKHIKTWKAAFEPFSVPVIVHDMDGKVVFANSAFIKMCGQTKTVGKECSEMFGLEANVKAPAKNCPVAKSPKARMPFRSEIHDIAKGKFYYVFTMPVTVEGTTKGILHSVTDITDVRKSELDYRELVDIYADAVNALKNKEQTFQNSRDAFLNMLEDISETYNELEHLFIGLVRALVNALDAKSPWTKGHSENVAMYAEKIAREMGFDEEDIKDLRLAGMLHDIGKIGTYDYLLDKPSKLTDEEFEIVKKHPSQGAKILEGIKQLKNVVPIIRHHHERLDGRGYPDGLKGDKIPIGARILHVVDSYDSMTSDRPYRPAPSTEYAISEFKKYSGIQFDAKVVDAFLKVLKDGRLITGEENN